MEALPLEIVISNFNSSTTNKDSSSLDNIFNLDFLTKADEFESKIEQISHIKKAISMNDYIKSLLIFGNLKEECLYQSMMMISMII